MDDIRKTLMLLSRLIFSTHHNRIRVKKQNRNERRGSIWRESEQRFKRELLRRIMYNCKKLRDSYWKKKPVPNEWWIWSCSIHSNILSLKEPQLINIDFWILRYHIWRFNVLSFLAIFWVMSVGLKLSNFRGWVVTAYFKLEKPRKL